MNKIILVERYGRASRFWPNMERDNNLELTVEQILYKYQGFEGDLISYIEIPENTNILNLAKSLVEIPCEEEKRNHFMLYVCSDFNNNDYLNQVAFKAGYDIGFCEDEGAFYANTADYSFGYASYSSIFHEVLFGKVEKLVAYKDFLNEHLLFSDRTLGEQYIHLHAALAAKGNDVENEPMSIYEIWNLKGDFGSL